MVYRGTISTSKRNTGDVYYYTPNGKKLRSMREIAENLKNKELTLEDFTFVKESLGVDDPEKEIVRDALKSTNDGKAGKKGMVSGLKVGAKGASSPRGESPSAAVKVSRH